VIAAMFSLLVLGEKYERPLLEKIGDLGTLRLWLVAVLGMSFTFFGMRFWARRVPQKVTISLAVAAWLLLLWMLFGLGWWDSDKPGKR
jgi:hypothetical protein